jgi:REP element-mobilizing transposase RayT
MEPELRKRRRNLPHWQLGGSVYFITFRSARGDLPQVAMRQVVANVLYDHRRCYDLEFGVVMPDHTHLLLQPLEVTDGLWHELPDIMKSLKGVSARRINQFLGTSGTVWQEEYFDRIVRDEHEYDEKVDYMWNNPIKAGLVEHPEDWEFFILPPGRAD